jgi:hypothetical protein
MSVSEQGEPHREERAAKAVVVDDSYGRWRLDRKQRLQPAAEGLTSLSDQ